MNYGDYIGRDAVRYYGCCQCQRDHREGFDEEFDPHIMLQSKHGIKMRAPNTGEKFRRLMEGKEA